MLFTLIHYNNTNIKNHITPALFFQEAFVTIFRNLDYRSNIGARRYINSASKLHNTLLEYNMETAFI